MRHKLLALLCLTLVTSMGSSVAEGNFFKKTGYAFGLCKNSDDEYSIKNLACRFVPVVLAGGSTVYIAYRYTEDAENVSKTVKDFFTLDFDGVKAAMEKDGCSDIVYACGIGTFGLALGAVGGIIDLVNYFRSGSTEEETKKSRKGVNKAIKKFNKDLGLSDKAGIATFKEEEIIDGKEVAKRIKKYNALKKKYGKDKKKKDFFKDKNSFFKKLEKLEKDAKKIKEEKKKAKKKKEKAGSDSTDDLVSDYEPGNKKKNRK